MRGLTSIVTITRQPCGQAAPAGFWALLPHPPHFGWSR